MRSAFIIKSVKLGLIIVQNVFHTYHELYVGNLAPSLDLVECRNAARPRASSLLHDKQDIIAALGFENLALVQRDR
jgi:hypothetical protein